MSQIEVPTKKVLIINWKWHLGEKWIPLNKETLSSFDLSEGIEKAGKGVFYQAFEVEKSLDCPNALVVATSIYNDSETKKVLYDLIDHYNQEDTEIILLVHRPNQYKEEDIHEITAKYTQLKNCSLFEGGRDYIYYAAQKSGLLDDVGGFFVGHTAERFVETIDVNDIVQQPYFDRVWNYYVGEFENKVLAFKEDLFDVIFPLLLPDASEEIAQDKLIELLKKDLNTSGQWDSSRTLLYYRMKSFLGQYPSTQTVNSDNFAAWNANRKEVELLKELEQATKASYLFDDSLANIRLKQEFNAYSEVKEFLYQLFFEKDGTRLISKAELRILADKLDYLTSTILGVIS